MLTGLLGASGCPGFALLSWMEPLPWPPPWSAPVLQKACKWDPGREYRSELDLLGEPPIPPLPISVLFLTSVCLSLLCTSLFLSGLSYVTLESCGLTQATPFLFRCWEWLGTGPSPGPSWGPGPFFLPLGCG